MAKNQGTDKRRPSAKPKRARKSRGVQFPPGTVKRAMTEACDRLTLLDYELRQMSGISETTWHRAKATDQITFDKLPRFRGVLRLPDAPGEGFDLPPLFEKALAELRERVDHLESLLEGQDRRRPPRSS